MHELEGSPKTYPPLGLPAGSVRALLTLIVVAVVVTKLARGQDLDLLWIETLLIALAHYFTTRRFVSLPRDVIRKLEQEGLIEKEWQPLFLPRRTIRTLIVGAFVALAIYLYREQRLSDPRAVSLLGIVLLFVLGSMVRGVSDWFHRHRAKPPSRFWADLKAALVLIVLAVAALPELLDRPDVLHPDVHKVALGLMLFYFGSR